jgi:pimeloyl-ACP methyl ester carboxylesterase
MGRGLPDHDPSAADVFMTSPDNGYHQPARLFANGIELAYDSFGRPADPPLLLVAGLGGQLIFWDEAFCQALADRGYWVIRYDNRDTGLSTSFDSAGVPRIWPLIQAWLAGQDVAAEAPYTIRDMAADAVGLLDGLAIKSAHIVGISLGGVIAQFLGIYFPERVRSLTIMASTSGAVGLALPQPEALQALLSPPPADRDGAIASSVSASRALNGPHWPFDEERARRRAAASFDRAVNSAGVARHMAALFASAGWKARLATITAPTLVIHGSADPLLPLAGGEDIARSIPGASLLVFDGLGHAMPPEIWPQGIAAIAEHARRATGPI